MGEIKKHLLSKLKGSVLEIGAGSGANFAEYPKDIHWTGVEPNTARHQDLRRAAQRFGFTPDVRAFKAEHMEIANESLDAVVSTRVLCSVDSQQQVLAEILRVLKPGGRYVFIEYVGAPQQTFKRRTQDFLQPVWGPVTGGCHLNRETETAIRSAGFARVEVEPVRLFVGFIAPHIAGVAIKG